MSVRMTCGAPWERSYIYSEASTGTLAYDFSWVVLLQIPLVVGSIEDLKLIIVH